MPTATAAPKPAAKKPRRVRFQALITTTGNPKPLKLTMQRMKEQFNAETGAKEALPETGRYLNFHTDGSGIQWYETADQEEIDFLRSRLEFGTYNEVPIAKPASAPVIAQILKLAKAGDKDALLALGAEEEDSYQRDDVLEAVADALELVG
jgi:hypothetical protein